MKKINDLTTVQLKDLLRQSGLSTTGNKTELVGRLVQALGTDEIEMEECEEPARNNEDNMQSQIDALKNMMETVLATVRAMSCATNREPNNGIEQVGETNVPVERSSRVAVDEAKFNVRDIVSILPEFDPRIEQQSAQQFVDKIENLRAVYKWPDNLILYAIHDKLKGHAKIWLDSQDVFQEWSHFVQAFKTDFPTELNMADVHIGMTKRVQHKGEANIDYYYHMLARGRQGKLDEKSIIRHIINGLQDVDERRTLNAMQFNNCPDLLKALNSSEKVQKQSWLPEFRKNSISQSNTATGENKSTNYVPTCFNCKEKGHLANKCQKPKIIYCTRCQKTHEKGQSCEKSATVRNIKIEKLGNCEKFITIEQTEYKALIDTGSECSLIRATIGHKLNCKLEKCRMRITGICGGSHYANEKSTLKLIIDSVPLELEFFLVDDTLLTTDVLLGQNLLKTPVKLTIDNHGIKADQSENESKVRELRKEKLNIDNVKCGINDECVKQKLIVILTNYEHVFATCLKEIGKTDLVTMKIKLTSDKVISQPPYRVPEPKRAVVKNMLDELLQNGIISPSDSNYASPLLLVKKKNGDERLCVDYRRLNAITEKENFPMQNIEESLQKAAKFKLFTVLDLNSGYYQIPISPECRKFTAVISDEGVFEFNCMSFGLKNAPIYFLRLMAKVKELAGDNSMLHYMDDILIGANSVEEMCKKLHKVLQALSEAGLTLNLKKCDFFKTNITFLGHELTPDGIQPGIPKTLAVSSFERPKNVSDVRRFLGLSGYFRKFVPGYAIISEPLRKLLRNGVQFEWADEEEAAMQSLKQKLTSEPILVAYKVEAEHEIHTDASSVGLAGVLLQRQVTTLQPVAYYSRATSDNEKKFHSYELEVLAVVESLERFRYYVYGKEVKIVTDCSAIKTAMEKRELIPRIARWWLRIQDFEVKIEHRSGQRMEHVDALSRTPYEKAKDIDVATMRIDKILVNEEDWLLSMQMQDETIRAIKVKLDQKDKQVMLEYAVDQGRLFRKNDGKKLWVVPKALRWHMLRECHDKNGHLAVEKTIERIKSYAWFPRMRSFAKSYVNSCVECAYNKGKGGKREGEFHFDEIEPVPFKTIHIDHLGPFPKTAKRNEHILVIVDSFTKYTVIKAVKNTATRFVISALNEMFSYFGTPQRIVSDRGTAFTSKEFRTFCKENDITHIQNAVRTPRANGHAERANRTLLSMLTTTTQSEKQWDQRLNDLQWSMNNMKNTTTRRTPHELLFSYNPRDILQNKILLALSNDECSTIDEMSEIRSEAVQKISAARLKAKQRFDQHRSKPILYVVGDLVLAEYEPPATGMSKKLEPKFKGPFIIEKVLGRDRYVVADLPGSKRTSRHYSSVYASDKLKPWCQLPEDIDEDFSGNSSDED